MEERKKKSMWIRLLMPIAGLMAVLLIAQIIVLKLLENGIIHTTIAMLLLCGSLVLVFGFVFIIVKTVLDQISTVLYSRPADNGRITERTQKLAESDGEIGQLIRTIQSAANAFAQVLAGIKKASGELNDASEEFQAIFVSMAGALNNAGEAVTEITENTVSQADHVVDMKEKIEAVSASIDRIADNIAALTKSAETMQSCNHSAEQIMQELVAISQESGIAIENVRKQTDRTNQSAQQIQTATEIIAGISGQTNLLALNASIEAARAGEHGRGFSVVAEEIRILADQSKESTEQINKIVNDLIENSNISVQITEQVSEAFTRQNEKIHDTEEIFRSLNAEIAQVGDSIDGIGGEVAELGGHRNMIEGGIISLTTFAKENADNARQTSESMEELRQIADECSRTTDKVVGVSEELVGYIQKFDISEIKKRL